MAQDTTAKKSNFLSNLVANAIAFEAARVQLKTLAEGYANDATIGGIASTDCIGSNSHLTLTIIQNYLTAFQPNFEKILAGTAVTPGAPYLPNILAVIPQ